MEPTCSLNVVITPLQRILILLNCITTFMPDGEWAFEDKKYLDHLIEIAVCNTIGENQAPKHLHRRIGIVDVDVTAYRTIHYLEQRRCC